MNTLSPSNRIRITAAARLLFAALITSVAFAQALPPAVTAPARPREETIVLSPFEVTADTGDKYGTTQSNSVTMFRTDTDRLPVTADVLTSQFMGDLGIFDLDILISCQAAGGGFGSVQSGDDALPEQPGETASPTPSSSSAGSGPAASGATG